MSVARDIRAELESLDGRRRVVGVRWLRNRFGHDRLTAQARREIAAALHAEGIAVAPELADAGLDDALELSLIAPAPGRWAAVWRRRLRGGVRVWQVAVGVLGLTATVTGLYSFGEERLRRPPPPAPLAGDLKILVAEFGTQEADGGVAPSPAGRQLATLLGRSLRSRLDAAPGATDGAAPYVYAVRGPAAVGLLRGDDVAARTEEAAQLAQRQNADVVISALVRDADPGTRVAPEFFVLPDRLPGAPELGGQYRFGTELETIGDVGTSAAAGRELRERLTARAGALAELLVGLAEFREGANARAARHFRTAAASPEWLDAGGKEVVYLFLGNALLRSSTLERAAAAFERALAVEPGFARAQFGLAEVRFQRACAGGQRVDQAGVRRAIDDYRRVLDAARQPADLPLRVKANFALGRALLCLTPPGCAEARERLEQVVADHDASRLRTETAEAHGGLGSLPRLCPGADTGAVLDHYRSAVALSELPARKAFYLSLLAGELADRGDAEAATRAYDEAIATEPSAAVRARYQRARRAALRSGEE